MLPRMDGPIFRHNGNGGVAPCIRLAVQKSLLPVEKNNRCCLSATRLKWGEWHGVWSEKQGTSFIRNHCSSVKEPLTSIISLLSALKWFLP